MNIFQKATPIVLTTERIYTNLWLPLIFLIIIGPNSFSSVAHFDSIGPRCSKIFGPDGGRGGGHLASHSKTSMNLSDHSGAVPLYRVGVEGKG